MEWFNTSFFKSCSEGVLEKDNRNQERIGEMVLP
jgi:hypothetical protein